MNLTDSAHFNDYSPDSFGWSRSPDLVPFQFAGVNFGQCARDAHGLFTALLTELVPHIPGGLKAGSCWAYSATDDLPDGSWSFHHYGIAIDINWNVNHMGQDIPDPHGQWALPRDATSAIARKYGCEWGGNWTGGFHDDMHIEIHVPPSVARSVTAPITPNATTDFMEELMSYYASKADFEAAVTRIARAEATRANQTVPVIVNGLLDYAHRGYASIEGLLSGIPGYTTLSSRKRAGK